ncbi:MAG: carbohydrate ABC transporter permease [Chloroflexota bacterium]
MQKGLIRRIIDQRWAYFFILPAYIPFLIFTVYPLIDGMRLSVYDADLKGQTFIGLENFRQLFQDEAFLRGFQNTVFFVAGVVPLALFLSLFIAVMIFPLRKSVQSFFRMSFYLPVVASGVILSMVWLWIYSPTFGLLNYILMSFGLPRVEWLGSMSTALPSLALVVLTWILGQPVILFVASLGNIPTELLEAAQIDGANSWQRFWKVTFPLLLPTTLYVLVTQTIGVFQVFVVVLLMTKGGPAYATMTIVYDIYQTAFDFYHFGYAAAMGVVLLLIVGAIAVIQYRFLGREVQY